MLSLENRVHSKLDCSTNLGYKWRDLSHHNPSDKAESRSLHACMRSSSAAAVALAARCYRGLPQKPAGAAPAALAAWTESSARLWGLVPPAPGTTAMGLCLRLSCSQSPAPTAHLSHLPTWVQAPPHTGCFPPPSLQLRQCTQRSLLTHHFHPGCLSARCCVTAIQSVRMFWTGILSGSRGMKFLSLQRKPWYPPAFTHPERAGNAVWFVQT